MILIWLIIIPLIGGLAAWPLGRKNSAWPRWISIASLVVDAFLLIFLCSKTHTQILLSRGLWLAQVNDPWIPQFGISISTG
jgi:NADH:ubiquinone oxidoreductase subunit 4 (subunit M)